MIQQRRRFEIDDRKKRILRKLRKCNCQRRRERELASSATIEVEREAGEQEKRREGYKERIHGIDPEKMMWRD